MYAGQCGDDTEVTKEARSTATHSRPGDFREDAIVCACIGWYRRGGLCVHKLARLCQPPDYRPRYRQTARIMERIVAFQLTSAAKLESYAFSHLPSSSALRQRSRARLSFMLSLLGGVLDALHLLCIEVRAPVRLGASREAVRARQLVFTLKKYVLKKLPHTAPRALVFVTGGVSIIPNLVTLTATISQPTLVLTMKRTTSRACTSIVISAPIRVRCCLQRESSEMHVNNVDKHTRSQGRTATEDGQGNAIQHIPKLIFPAVGLCSAGPSRWESVCERQTEAPPEPPPSVLPEFIMGWEACW